MKRLALVLALVVAVGAAACSTISGGGARKSGIREEDRLFFQELTPLGNWIERPPHVPVFLPEDVSNAMAPYADGNWVLSEGQWIWNPDFGHVANPPHATP